MNEIIAQINKCQNDDELKNFLFGLLTPQEIQQLESRIKIIRLLKQGLDHRSVAAEVGVGIATVTRGAKELHHGRFKHV